MVVIPYRDYKMLYDMVQRREINIGNLYIDGFPFRNFIRTNAPVHLVSTNRTDQYYYYADLDRNDGSPKRYVLLGPNTSIDLDDKGEPLSKAHINDPEIY